MERPRSKNFIALYIHEDAALGLVRAPTAKRVGFSQCGDVLWAAIDHGDAIQMTAIFRGQRADKRRAPAWIKTMIGVERAETTKASVDHPKFVVAIPCKLVDVDVAGDVNAARKITGVVLSRRLQLWRHRRHVAVLPDGVGAADRQSVVISGDAHRLSKCSEVSVEFAVIVADDDGFTRLISGNDQANSQLVK